MYDSAQLFELCGEQLVAPGLPEATVRRLSSEAIIRYSEPWRFYHITNHLMDVLGFLMDNVDKLNAVRPTLWSAVGHDSIYVPQAPAGVNEGLSAQLYKKELRTLLPGGEVASVGEYIRATANHSWDGVDLDLAYLLDGDVKVLGAQPDEFEEYDENIRREYSFVDPTVYKNARGQILRGFYDKDRIFVTDEGYKQFEEQAKANLERKLTDLTTK